MDDRLVDEDFDAGTTDVELGPAAHLSPQDMTALIRASRWRSTWSPLSRTDGGVPEQLGPAAEGFRAIQTYAFFGDNIPAMKEIEEYAKKNEVEKKDIYFIKGWLKGKVIAAAIENAIKKAGGKVPADIKAFRKSVRDEMEALKDFDTGGITPPFTYKDHQGSVQARIAEIKDGKYTPVGTWINAR